MAEYLEVSKEKVVELLQKLNQDYRTWEESGSDETALVTLINRNVDTYQLVQNSSTQEELDSILEQYDWAYPLFKTMNDLINGKLT